jgi:glycosyltransferase involved in cell wall biosynthesis
MPRRILVLNERDLDNPRAGGAEVHVFEIFGRLAARGHEVRLLAASFPGAARETVMRGVHVRRIADRHLYYGLVPFAARRELRQGYDVVVDVLNKLPFFSPWLLRRPCLAITHHLFGETAFHQVAVPIALVTYLSEKLIPWAYARTPVMAISDSTRDDLVRRGLPATHISVVPPGVDHAAYHPGEAPHERAPLVLWIGRLEHYKRVDVMIDAMAEIRRRVPEARLAIVGAGGARTDLERRVQRQGLADAVEFTGFIDEEAKIAWLRRAAVLVSTSAKEGWGLTVIEGNACGTPSVASDVPGLRDSVRDGETGLLVPHGDPERLADAVVRILDDPTLRARLVAAGLAWAAGFDWERVADTTEALIERAIAAG